MVPVVFKNSECFRDVRKCELSSKRETQSQSLSPQRSSFCCGKQLGITAVTRGRVEELSHVKQAHIAFPLVIPPSGVDRAPRCGGSAIVAAGLVRYFAG